MTKKQKSCKNKWLELEVANFGRVKSIKFAVTHFPYKFTVNKLILGKLK